MTTHLHDNRGERDDHLLPYEGTIDWSATLAALGETDAGVGAVVVVEAGVGMNGPSRRPFLERRNNRAQPKRTEDIERIPYKQVHL